MGKKTINAKEGKKSKNQLRRERAKLQKQQSLKPSHPSKVLKEPKKTEPVPKKRTNSKSGNDVDPSLAEIFKDVFQKFEINNEMEIDDVSSQTKISKFDNINQEDEDNDEDDEDGSEREDGTNAQLIKSNKDNQKTSTSDNNLSKRQFKKKYSIPLYVLKSECKRPEVIDWMDADSPDPRLHINLKSLPNVVTIPAHWQSKRSFLSTKKGIERPPFELPSFIRDTGILEMRNTDGNEDQSTLKQQMRERVQPKSGQLDIDYDRLYDAFFKYQKKPLLLKYGHLYTENTNNNDLLLTERLSRLKVGTLSLKLKVALGMSKPDGTVINRLPPWYYKMKELGPPPCYPFMNIDASGRITINNVNEVNIGPPIITKHWGTLINDIDGPVNTRKQTSEEKEEIQKDNNFNGNKGDVLMETFGADPTKNHRSNSQQPTSDSSKPSQLYHLLKTQESNDQNSIFGSSTTSYKLQR